MIPVLLALATANGTATVAPAPLACTRAATGMDAFCTASDGVRLHYVDWGGRGPVVILLAGLGNSARIFDDLAPRLARGHRVIAITRRGYGLSGDARSGDYGNARLVRDVMDVMDGLHVPRAALVGHSLAGGEMAGLAAGHPERVTRLVYLDAAYDRSAVPRIMAALPPVPGPGPAVLADLASMTRWRSGALGVDNPAVGSDLGAIMRQTAQGLRPRTPPATAAAILAGDMAAPPPYRLVHAPSLALYSSKDVAEQVPASAPAATREANRAYSVAHIRPWMLEQKARFTAEQRCGTAYEAPHSGHYLFLERPAWTARVVLAFLDDATPCDFAMPAPKP